MRMHLERPSVGRGGEAAGAGERLAAGVRTPAAAAAAAAAGCCHAWAAAAGRAAGAPWAHAARRVAVGTPGVGTLAAACQLAALESRGAGRQSPGAGCQASASAARACASGAAAWAASCPAAAGNLRRGTQAEVPLQPIHGCVVSIKRARQRLQSWHNSTEPRALFQATIDIRQELVLKHEPPAGGKPGRIGGGGKGRCPGRNAPGGPPCCCGGRGCWKLGGPRGCAESA